MSHTTDALELHIEQLEEQLDNIRELVEADQEIEKTEYPITVRYHALSVLRDQIYEVLEG